MILVDTSFFFPRGLRLAVRKGGQLATFDRHIPSRAVIGADKDHLQLIPA